MNSTLGYGLVLLGLLCAAFAAVVGLVTGMMRKESALPLVQKGIYGFAASMFASNLVMVNALLSHDFSVKYVSQVGSRSTPTIFTIVSLWSALEGSILFWGMIMGGYLFAFAWAYRREHGYSPSIPDVAKAGGVAYTVARARVKALEAKGYLTRVRYRARSLVMLRGEDGRLLAGAVT